MYGYDILRRDISGSHSNVVEYSSLFGMLQYVLQRSFCHLGFITVEDINLTL